MATKYQVFVSSTYEDLKGERDQVIRAVLEMNHIPVGMEMFSAADEQQWQVIARHIDESDYYAVIIAHRYGSMTTDQISYTRKEYEYAVSRGIPVLGFVIDESTVWPPKFVESGDIAKSLLDDFKSLVREKPVSSWTSAEDLYGKFVVALVKTITVNPREGWVRASGAVGPEVTAEISRLSSENAKLRVEVAQALRETGADLEAELSKIDSLLKATSNSLSYKRSARDEWQESDPVANSLLFDILAPSLMTQMTIKRAADYIYALGLTIDRGGDSTGHVAQNQVKEILADWMVFDIVMPSAQKHSVKDTDEYWSLTELGKDLHKMHRRRELLVEADAHAASAKRPRQVTRKVTAKKVTAKKIP